MNLFGDGWQVGVRVKIKLIPREGRRYNVMRKNRIVLILSIFVLLPITLLSCSDSGGGYSLPEVLLNSDIHHPGVENISATSSPDLDQNHIGADSGSSIRLLKGTTTILYRQINSQDISETFSEDGSD